MRIKIPADLPSGPYALHIRSGDSDETATREDYIPFFVTPAKSAKRNKIAFLAPTCAYMAYANHGEHITAREAERTIGRLLQFGHSDLYMPCRRDAWHRPWRAIRGSRNRNRPTACRHRDSRTRPDP